MKNIDKIILYLDNQLSESEKLKFEEELVNSPELFQEYQKIKTDLGELKNSLAPEADESYFTGIIPEFRRKHLLKKKSSALSFAVKALVPVSLAVIIFLVVYLNREQESTLELTDIQSTEAESFLNEYSVYESLSLLPENVNDNLAYKIDSVYISEIGDMHDEYFGSDDYNSLIASLSDDEAEIIYKELINKEI